MHLKDLTGTTTMAAGWIPRTKGVNRKPEVLAIARATGRSRREVTDILFDFWEWADEETDTGLIRGVLPDQLPCLIPDTDAAFWKAVEACGWIVVTADGIEVPHFQRWMGQSAKKRLKKNTRQASWRDNVGALSDSKAPTTEENRREEKSNTPPLLGVKGGAGGKTESRSWADGEFAAAVALHLANPLATALPWFPGACALISDTFGYRRPDDPRVLALWAKTFADSRLDEFEAAVEWVHEHKQPKSRRDLRTELSRRIADVRRNAALAVRTGSALANGSSASNQQMSPREFAALGKQHLRKSNG